MQDEAIINVGRQRDLEKISSYWSVNLALNSTINQPELYWPLPFKVYIMYQQTYLLAMYTK